MTQVRRRRRSKPFKGDGGLVDVGGDLRSGSARLPKPGSRSAAQPGERVGCALRSDGREASVCREDPSLYTPTRLLARGKSRREALRCIKRMLARHLYRQLRSCRTWPSPKDRVLDSREASPHRRRPVSSGRARLTCTRRAVSGRRPCPHEKQRPRGLEPRQRRIGLRVAAVDGAPAAT